MKYIIWFIILWLIWIDYTVGLDYANGIPYRAVKPLHHRSKKILRADSVWYDTQDIISRCRHFCSCLAKNWLHCIWSLAHIEYLSSGFDSHWGLHTFSIVPKLIKAKKISTLDTWVSYKKIKSYPQDGCVPRCKEAEGQGRRQDRSDLGMERGEAEVTLAWPDRWSDLGLLEARCG